MSRIHILPEHVASQIAAGEVVQRPASVVRELVDNSLDAGAGRLLIEVARGGNTLIRVLDDGCGMSKEELPMALRRHATSKIESEADLMSIRTFGFRGEALAAIASVSHVEIISRQPSERQGNRLDAIGSEVKVVEPIGVPPGTQVTVSDLFFNTPARKKFLKSPATEMDRVIEIFLRTAMSCPSIHFDLIHNERKVRTFSPVPSRVDRLVQIFGNEVVAELLPVDYANDLIQVTGFTSRATLHRNTASDVYFFVNGRFVRDRLLLRCLIESYRASLPQRRYPVTVLFIQLPPEYVDVNVHPSKEEIRFRDERLVWNVLFSALRQAQEQGEALPLPRAQIQREAQPVPANQPAQSLGEPAPRPPVEDFPYLEILPAETSLSQPLAGTPASSQKTAPKLPDDDRQPFQEPVRASSHRDEPGLEPVAPIESLNRGPLNSLEELKVQTSLPTVVETPWIPLAQVFDSYIVAQRDDQMALFDQHALHERIQFEKFRQQFQARSINRQKLLFPLTVEIPLQRQGALAESLDLLVELGFEMEPFGGNTYLVQSLPADLSLSEVKGLLEDALDDLASIGKVAPVGDRAEMVLARMACRSAVKAGDPLSQRQMEDLLSHYTEMPALATCPHGRPPIWKISRRELEKWFDR